MTEQRRVQPDWDDVQGHMSRPRADTERPEDDTEGHAYRRADAEAAEGGDDVEGHMPLSQADADRAWASDSESEWRKARR
jgi:hypothetical protein